MNANFVWPDATTLVRRAELAVGVRAPIVTDGTPALGGDRCAELATRLHRYEIWYPALHPPGYEATGRLVRVKLLYKKISRRLMWWYVEPRWTVHREMTSSLVAFAHESIAVTRSLSDELSEVRGRLADLEAGIARERS